MKNCEGLFPFLDFVLKNKNNFDSSLEVPSSFMINRWLSMSSIDNSKIINETTNKWNKNYLISKDIELLTKFYRLILIKSTKRLSYLNKNKKNKTTKTEDCFEHIHRECSKKEITNQKNLIEELNSLHK